MGGRTRGGARDEGVRGERGPAAACGLRTVCGLRTSLQLQRLARSARAPVALARYHRQDAPSKFARAPQLGAELSLLARERDGRSVAVPEQLEEVEHDFDAVVARLLFFIGAATDAADAPQAALALRLLRLARTHDPRRPPRDVLPAHVKAHVSDAAGKAQLRGLLLEPSFALGGELRALRAQLGYPVAEAGARASVAELSRRWRLMTTSTSPLDPVEHPLGPK